MKRPGLYGVTKEGGWYHVELSRLRGSPQIRTWSQTINADGAICGNVPLSLSLVRPNWFRRERLDIWLWMVPDIKFSCRNLFEHNKYLRQTLFNDMHLFSTQIESGDDQAHLHNLTDFAKLAVGFEAL